MAKMFMFTGKIYSVSDKNQLGEYVVVKMDLKHNVLGAKVIPAKSEAQVEQHVRNYSWDLFRNLPDNPVVN